MQRLITSRITLYFHNDPRAKKKGSAGRSWPAGRSLDTPDLNKSDYVDKINKILDDQSKFKRLGPVCSNYKTAGIESRLQKRLLDLVKADFMPKWINDAIRPTGSQRPRMYGFPKTHKKGTPLRPILSMTRLFHHELGK